MNPTKMFPMIWHSYIFFVFGLIQCQEYSPVVSISDGKLRGTVNKTAVGGKVYYAYRGIPFAKKPVGPLRFAAPVPNDPWNGILDATKDRDVCTQLEIFLYDNVESNVVGSEDCLYINVYTSNLNGKLPVMVWIYGGTFLTGSSSYSEYAPDYLLDKDVLYVAFNYRLGVFGFLSTEDEVSPGNWGLKDQILALHWVKNNIARFGGDPDKITIFGESAGAAAVSYLVNTNLTKGLFRAAIMQSGTALCSWSISRNSRRNAEKLGRKVNIFSSDSKTLIDRLRQVDYRKLKVAENNVTFEVAPLDDILSGYPFAVVQEPDHKGAVLSGRTYQILASGNFIRVPTIIGFNSNEIAFQRNQSTFLDRLYASALLNIKYKPQVLAPYYLTSDQLKRLFAGLLIRHNYFGSAPIVVKDEELFKYATVNQFNRPVRKTVNMMSRYSNVYYYQFSYQGHLSNPNRTFPGVQHAEDLGYIFYYNVTVSPSDALTIERMVTLWTNFAKTRNPISSNDAGVLRNVTWIPNTPNIKVEKAVLYLNISNTLKMEQNPDQENWKFYQNIYHTFGDPSYHITY